MTKRERLVAAARGGEVDRKPTVQVGGELDERADGWVVDELSGAVDEETGVLLKVRSPLAKAMDQGVNIYQLLEDDPEAGEAEVMKLAGEVREMFEKGMSAGVDGFFYEIDGAYPSVSSPMQYGGHFLEVDRELLGEVTEARLNVVYIKGDTEPYVDFTSDLPGHAFGWDVKSGVVADSVRGMREGAFALADGEGEIVLVMPGMAENWPVEVGN